MAERVWLKTYAEGVDWHAKMDAFPLFHILDQAAERWPDNTHVEFLGRRWSYAQTAQAVNEAARALQDLGVGKGIKVGLFLPNCPQFIISYYAILKAGGTVVNFSPLYSVPELLFQVEDSETDIMITIDVPELFEKMHKVMKQSRLRLMVVGSLRDQLPAGKSLLMGLFKRSQIARLPSDPSILRYEQMLGTGLVPAPVDIDPTNDLAVLQYTGGTTGTPKGAMLSHANLSINAQQVLLWDPDITLGQERMACVLPLFHVFAMTLCMNVATLSGSEIAMLPKFELEATLKLLAKRRSTIMAGVPTMLTAMLNHADIEQYDLSSIRTCFSGGAPLPVEVRKRLEARIKGIAVIEGYGLSETSPVATCNPIRGTKRDGSIGLPVPGTDIVIVDREDKATVLPIGETGEICIRGPQVMRGYYGRPDATTDVMKDGLLHTGDVGYMDDTGFSYIIDRDKDMILVGGFNVFPRHVEEAIYQHPAVAECCVIGIPDSYLGEVPKAFVVLKHPDADLPPAEMIGFLKERLGKHEVPRAVEFRSELPKTMIGKLSKKDLVAEEKAKANAAKAAAQN